LYSQVALRQAQIGSECRRRTVEPFAVRASAEKLYPSSYQERVGNFGPVHWRDQDPAFLGKPCDWGIRGAAVECLDMLSLDEYRALVHADAREAAERSLRSKFGRLSNRRILSVLRPAADQVDELRGRSDRDLLDDWFAAFTLHRKEMQSALYVSDYSTRPGIGLGMRR
jgi:hypothetical protein